MASRLERLMKHMGEEKPPPKLPSQAEQPQEAAPKHTTPSITETDSDAWWNATPEHPQPPAHQAQTQHPAAVPFTSNDGDVHFPSDSRKDEPASLGIGFAPTGAVFKFCYKFVVQNLQQPIATAFFDNSKIQNREWDSYYIWSDLTARPITFIREDQLLGLFDEINTSFPAAKLTISDQLRGQGLVTDFDEFPQGLRPRFLGHSTSRFQLEDWTQRLEMSTPTPSIGAADERTLEAYRAKLELANDIQKNKNKAKSAKRQQETVVKRQDMARTSARVQRYLGLQAKQVSPFDTTKAPTHDFDSDVIFIAIDVEAFERPPRMITEVGVATLDTRDLHGIAPGSNTGGAWQKFIRARHFRVAEYKDYVNHEFVEGHPDRFEFGTSEFVGKDLMPQKLASCFKSPYSGPSEPSKPEGKRTVVFVGHDVAQDINYLRQIGFDLSNYGNTIVEVIDTAQMYRVYAKEPNPPGLAKVLYAFDLEAWVPHNAGNDAVYTVWAMLAIGVKTAAERGAEAARLRDATNLEQKKAEAVERAIERVEDESQGWELDDEDDGGVALSPSADAKPRLGLPRKEEVVSDRGFYTSGGAPLDV